MTLLLKFLIVILMNTMIMWFIPLTHCPSLLEVRGILYLRFKKDMEKAFNKPFRSLLLFWLSRGKDPTRLLKKNQNGIWLVSYLLIRLLREKKRCRWLAWEEKSKAEKQSILTKERQSREVIKRNFFPLARKSLMITFLGLLKRRTKWCKVSKEIKNQLKKHYAIKRI